MNYKKFVEVTRELSLSMASEHFAIHYGLRNPRQGRGLGPNGVGEADLIRWYLGALERLYRTMTSPPWDRRPPKTDASGKTHVYVCDLDQVGVGDPFTTSDRHRVPFIVLSCRSHEPLTDSAMRRAAAEAIHEATHAFNAEKRPFHHSADFHWWAWFNEAMATFMESRVLPGNQDYFRFLSNWIDLPGVPLNDWRAAYQGCLFLHYLAETVDPGLPNRIWTTAARDEKPLQAIDRLATEMGRTFASAAPDVQDLFAHGYAMISYFLRDHTCGCFAPELCSRFGDRAVVESFDLSPGASATAQETLPHLASHYFRCFVSRQVDRVRFTLRATPRNGRVPFKAEAAIVRNDLSRGQRQVLDQFDDGDGSGRISLTTELSGLDGRELHHLVLVVSNCTHEDKDLAMDNLLPAGDPYEIEIAAA
jgi:hypothetical protein